ncbi:hypothetical protein [Nocardioides sediminis]|uniref:hypothetical protein n=1 Tax=Nocardioides sediminis TaxID=433648 RepID=UPI00131ED272|nr:hypothetical protein [Nocardioides sediminis]
MPGTEPCAQRRFEYGWLLAGLAWGALLGVGTATVPFLLVMLSGGETPTLDSSWLVALMWVVLLAISGATYGGMVGLVTGVVVMLVVGRDPAVRAARRRPAALALVVAPLAATALWYL